MSYFRIFSLFFFLAFLLQSVHAHFELGNLDRGYSPTWIDIDGDTEPDYCRIVGRNGLNGIISCTLGDRGKAGKSQWSPRFDTGYQKGRYYEKLSTGINFCRRVGEEDKGAIVCTVVTSGQGDQLNLGETTVRKRIEPQPRPAPGRVGCSAGGAGLNSSASTPPAACIKQYSSPSELGVTIYNSCDRAVQHRVRYTNSRGAEKIRGVLVCPGGRERLVECQSIAACNWEKFEPFSSAYE